MRAGYNAITEYTNHVTPARGTNYPAGMTDYRAKVVEVLSETSRNDTRGIISAILCLADALDGRRGAAAGMGPGRQAPPCTTPRSTLYQVGAYIGPMSGSPIPRDYQAIRVWRGASLALR